MKDFYHILATDVNCTSAEIHSAYQNLLKDFQSASTQNNRQLKSRLKDISKAYEVLSNPEKRNQYDRELKQKYDPKQFYTKAIDLTFTIILIFFTFVFGDYVITSIHNSKVAKAHKAVSLIASRKIKPHQKKHYPKIKTAGYTSGINSKIVKTKAVSEPLPAVNLIAANPVVANYNQVTEKNPTPEKTVEPQENVKANENQDNRSGFLYATQLKANETGIVNMRQTGSYNAAIIKGIPSGSKVLVLEKGDNYYKVKFEDNIGYVPKWTLEIK